MVPSVLRSGARVTLRDVQFSQYGGFGNGMETIPVDELKAQTFFTEPVYLDGKFILLSPETSIPADLIRRLRDWGIREVYTDGKSVQHPVAFATEEASEESAAAVLDRDIKENEHLEEARVFYNGIMDFLEGYYAGYVERQELSLSMITEKVKDMITAMKYNRRFILRLSGVELPERNYLVTHSVKAAVFSLAIGHYLKLPQHRLIELGIAALLHKIGMIRLPSELYMANRALSDQERRAIMAHPVLGFQILKSMSFPMSISLAVLEYSERLDGSGYPRGLAGDKISFYARIIAVSCSYEAATSKRPYREARTGHLGLLDLLRDRGKQYDDQALKALVYSLSIFPLGSFVALTNGALGVVVENNQDNPRFPVVKLLVNEAGEKLMEPPLLQTSEQGVHIQRPLTSEELVAIQKSR